MDPVFFLSLDVDTAYTYFGKTILDGCMYVISAKVKSVVPVVLLLAQLQFIRKRYPYDHIQITTNTYCHVAPVVELHVWWSPY